MVVIEGVAGITLSWVNSSNHFMQASDGVSGTVTRANCHPCLDLNLSTSSSSGKTGVAGTDHNRA
ncbi:hypothetical protein D3C81_1007300 [compost metagenome]